MSSTLFGFYELDAGPQHGITGDLASRLGAATQTAGFIDGTLFVRSDHGEVALAIQHEEIDGWEDVGAPATLLQALDWRSRSRDVGEYRLVRSVAGDGEATRDSTFFVVQRFVVERANQDRFVAALCSYAETYAQPISGFLAADAYAGVDGTRVALVMPWAHEAALNALENRDGSLSAMQEHLRMSERHAFAAYQRVSYVTRGSS